MDKSALKDELLASLRSALEVLERAQEDAASAATHEEAKAEDDKDTRAIEQSYVARGHAMRIEELRVGIALVEAMVVRAFKDDQPIALGALITVDEDGKAASYFLAPQGGGAALAEGRVQVVTPKSPLGRALLGKYEGDECEVQVGPRLRSLAIDKVR